MSIAGQECYVASASVGALAEPGVRQQGRLDRSPPEPRTSVSFDSARGPAQALAQSRDGRYEIAPSRREEELVSSRGLAMTSSLHMLSMACAYEGRSSWRSADLIQPWPDLIPQAAIPVGSGSSMHR